MQLTEEQKASIVKIFHESPDLIHITREVFGNGALKGSSREGRLVRDFLLEKGLRYRTTKRKRLKPIELTEEQKTATENLYDSGFSSFQIAKDLFGDEIKKLGLEQRAVLAHLQEINPTADQLDGEASADGAYSPTRNTGKLVKKILEATGYELNAAKMSRMHSICVDRLAINLSNSRFVKIINAYGDEDRELFEHEFVRLTWDKPDLTADEINLYMNMCKEIIHMEELSADQRKLHRLFHELESTEEMAIKLSDMIKTKDDQYHKCEKSIEDLTKKLQGDRAERMRKRRQDSASFLAIVQLFQDEEERRNMVRIADMQKEAVREEADNLETMDMWIARIIGVDKDDVI